MNRNPGSCPQAHILMVCSMLRMLLVLLLWFFEAVSYVAEVGLELTMWPVRLASHPTSSHTLYLWLCRLKCTLAQKTRRISSLLWWHTPIILALGWWRQKDLKFNVTYTMKPAQQPNQNKPLPLLLPRLGCGFW